MQVLQHVSTASQAIVVLHVIRTGDHCSSLGMWSCSMELVRVITVMTGMLCHTVSLLVILWNVDKLDQVLELTEDIKEFKKTKDQIESLNKNDLADKDLDMKTLEARLLFHISNGTRPNNLCGNPWVQTRPPV